MVFQKSAPLAVRGGGAANSHFVRARAGPLGAFRRDRPKT